METATQPKETIWTRLAAGKFPSFDVNTEIGMTNASLLNLGGVIFIAGFLIVLTWYVLKNK